MLSLRGGLSGGPPQDGGVRHHIDPPEGGPRRLGLCDMADIPGTVYWKIHGHFSVFSLRDWQKKTFPKLPDSPLDMWGKFESCNLGNDFQRPSSLDN